MSYATYDTDKNIAIAKAMKLWRCNSRRYRTLRDDYGRLMGRAKGLGVPRGMIPVVPLSDERQWPMIPFLFKTTEYEAKCFLNEQPTYKIQRIIRDIEMLPTNNSFNVYVQSTEKLGSLITEFEKPSYVDAMRSRKTAPYPSRAKRALV